MTPSFNLLDEPWLPVRLQDGQVQNMGLLEVFARSNDITSLAETAPPSLVAQYRLLLAITHRALTQGLTRWTDTDRAQWYHNGLPLDVIQHYLEHWRERFWLFHQEHPFMQVAALAESPETRDKKKPWTQISLAAASGNTPVMFDHATDTAPTTIRSAEAIRALLGFLQFTPGGLVKVLRASDKAGALANSAAALPVGNTLCQTLILALHAAPAAADDLPAWEQSPPTIKPLRDSPTLATGPNDRYTRLSRAVLFIKEEDDHIRWLHFAAGLALEEDTNAPDPMASYRASKDKLIRLTFNEGRALWRDLPVLVPTGRGQAAAVLDSAINLHAAISFDDVYQPVLVAGLCSDQAKLLRWRAEQIALPCSLITEPDKAQFLALQIERSESLFTDLRILATSMLADTLPDSSSKDARTRARSIVDAGPLGTSYFAAAERKLSPLMELIAGGDFGLANNYWNTALRSSAQQAWLELNKVMGRSAQALRAMARYEGRLHALLNKQVPREKELIETET